MTPTTNPLHSLSSFQYVSRMNEAFGNPRGNYAEVDWYKAANEAKNIETELVEFRDAIASYDKLAARDALCDIIVFAMGTQFKVFGVDGDADMQDVLDGVMSRFVKNSEDKEATIAKHTSRGVETYYFEGTYPTCVMKSAGDWPDAPKGKFLKSASYSEPVFREPPKA